MLTSGCDKRIAAAELEPVRAALARAEMPDLWPVRAKRPWTHQETAATA
jgi:hypothetical protein